MLKTVRFWVIVGALLVGTILWFSPNVSLGFQCQGSAQVGPRVFQGGCAFGTAVAPPQVDKEINKL